MASHHTLIDSSDKQQMHGVKTVWEPSVGSGIGYPSLSSSGGRRQHELAKPASLRDALPQQSTVSLCGETFEDSKQTKRKAGEQKISVRSTDMSSLRRRESRG